MKHMKRILALALALMLTLGLATTAFAANEGEGTPGTGSEVPETNEAETFTMTITAPANASLDNHVYKVYQIFTGDLAQNEAGKPVLSNVKYGENYGTKGAEVPEALLTELNGMSGEAAAKKLNGEKTGNAIATLSKEEGWDFTALVGYYLIVDVSKNLPEGETSSAFILQLTDDVTVTSKHTAGPIVEKKIDDTNDSDDNALDPYWRTSEVGINWQDSADHDIGDAIPFKLEMTVPAAFDQFVEYDEEYRFVFHDKEEQGLTFQNDAKVYVNGTEITSGFEVDSSPEDGDTFDVIFADLTTITGLKVGDVITVKYTSVLNENAILGSQGNVNEVYGEYSNLHDDENPGFTPKDTVIAFTYKVVVNKVDKDKKALPGAEFTLEKYIKDTDKWIAIDQVETEPGTIFTFKGLDDGKYRLTETKTPDGYNSIDPIEFIVTAEHNVKWEVETQRTDILTSLTGNVTTGEITFTKPETEPANSTLSTDVVNKAGTVLPETGGIGTTIFYVVGGLLAVAAVVLLVTKKRMNTAE